MAQAAPAGSGTIRVTFTTPEAVPGLLTLDGAKQDLVATKSAEGETAVVELTASSGRYALEAEPVMSGSKRYVAVADPLRNIQVKPGATVNVDVTYTLSKGIQDLRQVGVATDSVTLSWTAPRNTSVKVRRTVGDVPASSPSQGVAVPVTGSQLVDDGVMPGTTYTYALWATPGDSAHGVARNAGPVVLTVGTSDLQDRSTPSYVVRPGSLLAQPGDVASAQPTGDGVVVTFAAGVAPLAPGTAVVLPVSQTLRGGYLGVVTDVAPDGLTVVLRPGGLAEAFDFYHLEIPDLGALPVQRIDEPDAPEQAGVLAAPTAAAGVDEVLDSAALPVQVQSVPEQRLARPGTAAAQASLLAAASDPPSSGEAECRKLSITGQGIDFDPGFELAGHLETTVDTYGVLGLKIPTGFSFDTSAAVTLSGAVAARVTATYACTIKLPSVMVPLPAGPVPMSFYLRPTARMGVSGAVEFSNLGAAATLGFAADGYVGFNGENYFDGEMIDEVELLTPQLDNVAGGFTARVGGDMLIGPGAGTTVAGVVAGIGGTLYPLDARAMINVATTPGGSACLSLEVGGRIGVLVSARAWLGPVDFKADYLVPGLSTTFDYLGKPWYYPTDCTNVPDPSDDVLGDGVTKVDDDVDGDPEQWGYLDGFAPGSKAWVLSTGYVSHATGDPTVTASTDLGKPGNASLTAYSGFETYDAAAYRVRLIPTGDTLHVRYVFASEEYPEWVGSQFNDVMAVFVNGQNCAYVPGTTTPVSINTINDHTNSEYYVDNASGASGYQTSFDGLTTPLQCSVPVTPGVPVDVEIAVADGSDHVLDSAVALLDKGIWSD